MQQAARPRFPGLERIRATQEYEVYDEPTKHVLLMYFASEVDAALYCLLNKFFKLNFHTDGIVDTDGIVCGKKIDEWLRPEHQNNMEYHQHVLVLHPVSDVIQASIRFYDDKDGAFAALPIPSIQFTRELSDGTRARIPAEEYEPEESKYRTRRNRVLVASYTIRDYLKEKCLIPTRVVISVGEYGGTTFFETPVPAHGTVIVEKTKLEEALLHKKVPRPFTDRQQLFERLYGNTVEAYQEDMIGMHQQV